MEKNKILFDDIDVHNLLFRQWHPIIKKFTSGLNNDCVSKVVKNTQVSYFDISKYKAVNNFTNSEKCKEILTRIKKEKSTDKFLKILEERDSIHPRDIKRKYSIEEILKLVSKNEYHPLLFLELEKKYYIIDGRTRLYCCIFLNVPAKVRIVSEKNLYESCK